MDVILTLSILGIYTCIIIPLCIYNECLHPTSNTPLSYIPLRDDTTLNQIEVDDDTTLNIEVDSDIGIECDDEHSTTSTKTIYSDGFEIL